MENVICLVSKVANEILLVKKKDVWILPGGKPEKGDKSYYETIKREFKEELPGSRVYVSSYYDSFSGITPYSKRQVNLEVYFGKVFGDLMPSSEISEAKYIKDFENYNLSYLTRKVLDSLKNIHYI